jgi:alanine dehydrogenase
MKFGIVKERKNPPDKRVVFSPAALVRLQKQFPEIEIEVESSNIRIFSEKEYTDLGIKVLDNISSCDVFFGVKEIPVSALIPNKKYFFFSHTIKKQAHNQQLLKAVLHKNITLFDHETIIDKNNNRLIGFGRYAGIVGAYNGFRAFGVKFGLFNIPKANTLSGTEILISKLKHQILPPIKIVLTGSGKVANGVKEILDGIKIKQVSIDGFLTKKYSEPVYIQIDVLDYNKRLDGFKFEKDDFYKNPTEYISDFERFTKVADIFMAGHFYGNNAPEILSRKMLLANDCNLKVVADISCDVNGPIACTIKASTIENPFFGYYPLENKEVDIFHPAAIVVMSVDNLPCELPKESSEGFGEMFLEHVIPSFFNNDKDSILARAKMTENGKLTPKFSYLQDYVDAENIENELV